MSLLVMFNHLLFVNTFAARSLPLTPCRLSFHRINCANVPQPRSSHRTLQQHSRTPRWGFWHRAGLLQGRSAQQEQQKRTEDAPGAWDDAGAEGAGE